MSAPHDDIITRTESLGHRWSQQPVFRGLQFALPAGVTLLQGEEQSGKTTLLRILSGDIQPSEGWVETQGLRADQAPEAYQRLVFRTEPHNEALDQISASAWFQELPARYPRFDEVALRGLIEGFALTPHLEKPQYMLSAGSRRKVGLTAAFASGAALTLLDQPFAALDAPSARLLKEVLQEMAIHPRRACVIADYEAPEGIELVATLSL